jgi:hypothetical protein
LLFLPLAVGIANRQRFDQVIQVFIAGGHERRPSRLLSSAGFFEVLGKFRPGHRQHLLHRTYANRYGRFCQNGSRRRDGDMGARINRNGGCHSCDKQGRTGRECFVF